MKSKLTLAAACAALALAAHANAAVIINFAMTGTGQPLNGGLSAEPTALDANVTATGLRLQTGLAPTGSFAYNANTDRVISAPTAGTPAGTTFAQALTNGSYLMFSITPQAGYTVSLDSITFQAASGSNNATSDRAFYLVAETAPANFTTGSTVLSTDRTAFGGGTMPIQAATATNTVPKDYNVSLTGVSTMQSFGASTTQYFRLYLQTPSSAQAITFDDIVLNGTVSAIPEPSSFAALAGLGALGCVAFRRRRVSR
ncbi:MAG: PEP-CTERM sorting domain-containing protein [Burkholderiales bacterium]|nr:PEP-CTERM sorting domain-containing protein [Opitutaceae bacterium]